MGAVLVTNDDGIDAPGLKALVNALVSRGFRVYVSAPRRPSSSYGKALLYPATYGEARLNGALRAWWVDSTPAAAVLAALGLLLPERPRLVVSGINRGPNMGVEDLFTSGTIGAAVEAVLHGIPAMAVSLATDGGYSVDDYRVAAELAADLASLAASNPPPPGAAGLLVVNVPEGVPRGIRVTRLAWNDYRISLRAEGASIAPRRHGFRERYWDRRPGSDVEAVLSGYASLTPVCLARLSEPPREATEWASRLARGLEGHLQSLAGH